MFPGSFDPPTNGHINIIKRSARLFDELYVVVADNINKNNSLFSLEEKLEMLNEIFADCKNIRIVSYSGLMVQFAKEFDIDVMIRGVRAQDDFNYEFELAMNNRFLNPELEVMFIPTEQKYFLVRSSQVKEFAHFGVDISPLVPPNVEKRIREKMKLSK